MICCGLFIQEANTVYHLHESQQKHDISHYWRVETHTIQSCHPIFCCVAPCTCQSPHVILLRAEIADCQRCQGWFQQPGLWWLGLSCLALQISILSEISACFSCWWKLTLFQGENAFRDVKEKTVRNKGCWICTQIPGFSLMGWILWNVKLEWRNYQTTKR